MKQEEPTSVMLERFRQNPDIYTSNIDRMEKGLADEFTPPIQYCEHCGKVMEHWAFGWQERLWWRKTPLRCTCAKAQSFWRDYDMRTDNEQAAADAERDKQQRRLDLDRLLAMSGVEARYTGRTLDSFSDQGVDPSIAKALAASKYFVAKFESAMEKGKGIIFVGPPGVGKTHLTAGIARAVIEQHKTPVMMLSMVDLLARLRATYNDNTGESEALLMRTLGMVDLLIIDDLGKEHPTSWTLERVYRLIDGRYQTGKCVIVTTNYDDKTLVSRLSKDGKLDTITAKAIVSRLHEMCASVNLTGRDHRTAMPGGGAR